MIQACANVNCNIGIGALWFLLGHMCSYYSVLLANTRVNNSSEQWIELNWLREKSPLVLSCEKYNETSGLIKVSDFLPTCVTVTYSRKPPFSFFFSSLISSTDSL